jgi:primosomal replication protein N
MGRPSMPASFFGTPLPQVQLSSALPQNISNSQPSVSSVQPRPPPPPPPPQQPHPSQALQQLGAIQLPQSAMLPQVPLQFPNQLPIPQLQLYHQSQQESVQTMRQVGEQSQLQNQGVQADSFSQQQQDSGINLNQFFSSPEAIQVLLLFIFICEATFGENSMSR